MALLLEIQRIQARITEKLDRFLSSSPASARPDDRLAAIEAKLDHLLKAQPEHRVTRAEYIERLGGMSPKTFKKRMDAGLYPRPHKDGKWFLSEIEAWEARQTRRY